MALDIPTAAAVARKLPPQLKHVLRHLAEGLSRKEIADRMELTPGTVDAYCSNLYGKLGVSNSREATRVALYKG